MKKFIKKPINAVSKNRSSWEWKPEGKDIPAVKFASAKNKKKKGGSRAKKKKLISRMDSNSFYVSDEWRKLRVRVLQKYGCRCMMCGRNPKEDGVKIHVDHIKPLSKHPKLALVFENLQILCEDCNLGKSNLYETDWRPDTQESEDLASEKLDSELLSSGPFDF